MTQKIMMVVEQPRPVVMQTTEFARGSGSSDYDALTNKPAINGVTLEGDKTTAELGLPTKTSDLENDSGFITSVPVTSVNGQTGAVVLTASDVGAGTYSKPSGGIPASDLASAVQTSLGKADTAYQKPSGGIPKTDLASAVQTSLGKADAAYQKPSGGIPATDLASAVQTSLGKADTALQSAPVTSVNGQTGAVTVAEPFVVTYSTSDMTNWTCDKTFAQITAAMAAGKQVVMLASVAGTPIVQACSFVVLPSGIQAWVRIGQTSRYSIQHLSDNSVIITEFTESAQWLGAVPENQGVSEAGKFLVVGSDGNVVPEDPSFVVTLIPTAQDMSGVMDKTVAEIYAAYGAGKKIMFKVLSGANEATYADCTMQYASGSYAYPSFNGFIISNFSTPNLLIFAFTSSTNDGTKATYSTTIYPLATGQWTGGSY